MSDNREEIFVDNEGTEWYRESGAPVWPSRIRMRPRFGYEPDRKVADILTELRELAAQTDPALGSSSTVEKSLKARLALGLANNLVAIVAGWAIDHEVGLAKDGLRCIGRLPQAIKDKFPEKLSALDDHEHERRGGHPDVSLNPAEMRELLRSLLDSNPGAFPECLTAPTIHDLDRIAFGEPSKAFQVEKSGNKKNLYSVELEAWSAVMVAYRMEMGATWEDATQAVADAFGKSPDTVKGWETNAKKRFGSLEIETMKNSAREAARAEKAEQQAALANAPLARPGLYSQPFDDRALQELVTAYNASLR